jgi:hypothetical protein
MGSIWVKLLWGGKKISDSTSKPRRLSFLSQTARRTRGLDKVDDKVANYYGEELITG